MRDPVHEAEQAQIRELLALTGSPHHNIDPNTIARAIKASAHSVKADLTDTVQRATKIAIDAGVSNANELARRIESQGKRLDTATSAALSAAAELKQEVDLLRSILPEASLKRINAITSRLADEQIGRTSLALTVVDQHLTDLLTGGAR